MPRGLACAVALLALSACGPNQEPAATSAGSAAPRAPPAAPRADQASAAASAEVSAAPAEATTGKTLYRIVGFRTPRSVIHDPEADVYLVSNVNGDPAAADDDDNGFISRVSPDGHVLDLAWIDGADRADLQLSAPMGMAISGGRLWVADRNQVHSFDARTGKHRASEKIAQATELADVAVLGGAIIVSDNGSELAGALFRLRPGRRPARYLAPDTPGVGHPQGLYAPGDGSLWVTSGRELYRVERGRRTGGARLPQGGLDGIVGLPGGELLVASHDGAILRGAPRPGPGGAIDAAWTPLVTGLEAPGDLGYDARRRRVLIPLVLANAVEVRELPP